MASPSPEGPWWAVIVPDSGPPVCVEHATAQALAESVRDLVGVPGMYIFAFGGGERAAFTRGGRRMRAGGQEFDLVVPDPAADETDDSGYVGTGPSLFDMEEPDGQSEGGATGADPEDDPDDADWGGPGADA